ncbi:MAG TPA: hypothetical protein VGP42_13490 [Stellaceae bacterium]|jgi:hypothetical protein|nr:hypothetical protein [Stellaceae bacterium]
MTTRQPTFVRAIAPDNGRDGGVAAAYNAAEVTAWTTACSSAAPSGSTDPAEATYLASCLAAAKTAGYTPGTQTGGVGANNATFGVGNAIIQRLLALGTNDLTS